MDFRRLQRNPPSAAAVGLMLAGIALGLLLAWWLLGGGGRRRHVPTASAPGAPGRSAEKPLPAVLGPITAFDRSIAEQLLRDRPRTTPLHGALRLQLDRVAWDDATGRPFVRADRVTGRLDLDQVLRGNAVVSGVDAVRPQVWLYRTGRDTLWNYERVLAAFLGGPAPGEPALRPGAERLVEVRGLTVHGGFASVRLPEYETRFLDVAASLPRITLSAPHLEAPTVQVAQGSAIMERPDRGWRLAFTGSGATIVVGEQTRYDVAQLAFGRTRLTDIHGIYDSRLPGFGVQARGEAPEFYAEDVKTFAPTIDLVGSGSGQWEVEPTPDNGVRVALTGARYEAEGSTVSGDVTFTALGDREPPALQAADLHLDPLRLALVERFTGKKLPYAGSLTGHLRGTRGNIGFDVGAHLAAPGVPAFDVGVTGSATFSPQGVTIRNAMAELKRVPLEALRPVLPALPLRGNVSGHVALTGPNPRAPLRMDVRLDLPAGVALLDGTVDLTGTTPSYDLTGRLLGVRLRELVAANLPPVTLTAGFAVNGRGFAPAQANATFRLNGGFSGWRAGAGDSVALRGSVGGGVLRLDTLSAQLATARVAAGGTWPFSGPGSGAIAYTVNIADLAPFAPYIPNAQGNAAGSVRATGTVAGTLQAPHLNGRLGLTGARVDGWSVADAAGTYDLQLGAAVPRIGLELQGRDVATPTAGTFSTFTASIRLFSPQLTVALRAERQGGGIVDLAADGSIPEKGTRTVTLQRLAADVGQRRWQLVRPAVVQWVPDGPLTVQGIQVQQQGGPGLLALSGTLLPADASNYRMEATAVPVADFYQLAGQPSPLVGLLYLTADVHGPAATPVVNGTFRLDSGSVQGVKLGLLQGTLHYQAGRLTADARASLAQGGAITASAALPVALRLGLPPGASLLSTGPVTGSLVADTVPLALLSSFSTQVTKVAGVFSASMSLGGTSQQPVLAGRATVRGGAFTVGAAQQRYTDVNGTLTLRDRRISVDSIQARSGGLMTLAGAVDFPELRNPVADLAISFDGFRPLGTADNPNAAATGRLTITGPLLTPTVRGNLRLDDGNLMIPAAGGSADLATEAAALGVADLVPSGGQQAVPAVPLSDRVRLDGVQLTAGPNLWFQMPGTRVQLSGTLTVDKAPDAGMRIFGTLEGERGYYTVVAGPIVRRLDVALARIRFLGTGDLNPEIEAVATKTILDPQSRPVEIQARVTGTLENPQLALSTSAGVQVPESELLSFLMFGAPSFALGGTGVGQALLRQTVFGGITEVASMQLQQSLMSYGLPLDIFEIQPTTTGQPANLVVGRELAPNVFLTVQTAIGVLFGNVGQTTGLPIAVRLEWRMTPRLTSTLGYEPISRPQTLHGFFTIVPQLGRQDKQFTLELRRRWTY